MSRRAMLVMSGLMLSLFLASMESTVVSTAMPTIVSQLGGLKSYSWVFAAFMLTSTTTVPLFGKLSDIYGRKSIFISAMFVFLVGSLLCGVAQSMTQLIAFRAVQGIGAGGLLPLIFTMIGDMFTLEQRARIQGFSSAVWGVSAIAGPLLGGFLVDQISWHWVFFVNIVPGLIAGAIVWFSWQDKPRSLDARPAIDWAGAALLTATVVLLLLGLLDIQSLVGLALIVAALACGALLWWVEQRAADPVVPFTLFRDRVFAVACAHSFLAGCALFGMSSFIPLFAQAVLGTSATGAGAVLAPMLLAWVVAAIISGRLILHLACRTLVVIGSAVLMLGSALLIQAASSSNRLMIGIAMGLMGIGMGLALPAFLIAVQSTVQRRYLGSATSTVQFSRSIGGTIGVSIMGAVLSIGLASRIAAAGLPVTIIDDLLGAEGQSGGAQVSGAAQQALAGAMQGVFIVALVCSVLALIAVLFTPPGKVSQLALGRKGDEVDAAGSAPVMSGH